MKGQTAGGHLRPSYTFTKTWLLPGCIILRTWYPLTLLHIHWGTYYVYPFRVLFAVRNWNNRNYHYSRKRVMLICLAKWFIHKFVNIFADVWYAWTYAYDVLDISIKGVFHLRKRSPVSYITHVVNARWPAAMSYYYQAISREPHYLAPVYERNRHALEATRVYLEHDIYRFIRILFTPAINISNTHRVKICYSDSVIIEPADVLAQRAAICKIQINRCVWWNLVLPVYNSGCLR